MSVCDLTRKNASEVPIWTDLYVNSLRSRNGILIDKDQGDYNVYMNTDTGLDTNDGLSALTPVLTLEKAISVLSQHSAETGIINCDGAARIIPTENLDDIGIVIDVSSLEARYSEVQLKGTPVIDVPEFTYAGANAVWGPNPVVFRQLDSLTLAGNPKICHKISATAEEYAHLESNTATTANLVGGGGIVTGNQIEFISLSGQELFIPARTTIIGNIRFFIKELIINNDGTAHSLVCNENTYFGGCAFDGIEVLKGEATLQGCSSEPGISSRPFGGVKLDINSFLHQGDNLVFSKIDGLVQIKDLYSASNDSFLEITYDTEAYISNSIFSSFAIYVTKNSKLTTVDLHFSGGYITYTPLFVNNSVAYLDATQFSNTSNNYNLEIANNGRVTFDGALISTSTTQFGFVDECSELNLLDGGALNINSSTVTTAIDLRGRSRLYIGGPAGTISSTDICILLQNGSTAYIADSALSNSGTGVGIVKVGGLPSQIVNPLVDQFDSGDEFSILNV